MEPSGVVENPKEAGAQGPWQNSESGNVKTEKYETLGSDKIALMGGFLTGQLFLMLSNSHFPCLGVSWGCIG